MLEYLIILASWITPGILLFLYLLWVSKREDDRCELDTRGTQPAAPDFADDDGSEPQRSRPNVAAKPVVGQQGR